MSSPRKFRWGESVCCCRRETWNKMNNSYLIIWETQCRRLAGTRVRQWRDVIWISQFHKRRFIWINEGSKLSLNLIWKLPTSLLSSSQRFNFSRKTFEVFIFLTEWEKRKYSLNKKNLQKVQGCKPGERVWLYALDLVGVDESERNVETIF